MYGGAIATMKILGLTIFTGAFLLFQVQPLLAKFILPWFGGGPGVWTMCLVFFQVVLLLGYGYAHGISRYLSARAQALTHVGLLVVALCFLPIIPSIGWKPGASDNPTWRILLLLTVTLGVPYLTLATTGPLLQVWFSRLFPGRSAYRLYALSNVGSLLALVSYPIVFEPALTRQMQAKVWSWSFATYAILCGVCALRFWRGTRQLRDESSEQAAEATDTVPSRVSKAMWFGFPACASVLLLATTNKLCQDLASVPFLWILPLGLYLLTFILCFDRARLYPRKTATALMIPAVVLMCYALVTDRVELWAQIAIYCGCLFVFCMICHGEVYRLRPSPRFLTSFYLFVAAGGAAGGLFVGLVAPLIFQSYAELNWGLWLICALAFILHALQKTRWTFQGRTWRLWPLLLFNVIIMAMVLETVSWNDSRNVVSASRSFYGVLRVRELDENGPMHCFRLMNGGINHGVQFVNPAMRNLPTSYYAQGSGLGVVMRNFPRQNNRRIGVIGLGVGTVAAYAHAGDTIRFYEINPEVERLARTRFTYLEKCAGNVEVVIGDARLSLENEPAQQFDILVLDAFSSDAIPTHLLTREAFEIYFRHLNYYGAMAVHISNRHLNLLPVMTGIAKQFQTQIVEFNWRPPAMVTVFVESDWVIISRNQPFMMSPDVSTKATTKPMQDSARAILWTDDRASLVPILK
jgi:hypothetical protein